MLKLFTIGLIVLSSIVVECRPNEFPLKASCLKDKSACKFSTQCCSGICCNENCVERPCRRPLESCNNSTDICCPGEICGTYSKTCCRLSNETASSSFECCVEPATSSGRIFICPCSGHAQPCKKKEDCCDNMQCTTAYPQFGDICL
ncbi:unnamed protein product [Adineta steineri]|uniref:Uncharacterized protein n=1 Tax=Adineta steineri TaxID=433720 RepID=A0A814HNM4_9BILA|nr:unnamed protein product [Adineta steineri]CAF4003826.1 unnamed protein product [Adineta steineri]